MLKRIFAVLLVLCMMLGMVGFTLPCEECGGTDAHVETCAYYETAEEEIAPVLCTVCWQKGGHAEGCMSLCTCGNVITKSNGNYASRYIHSLGCIYFTGSFEASTECTCGMPNGHHTPDCTYNTVDPNQPFCTCGKGSERWHTKDCPLFIAAEEEAEAAQDPAAEASEPPAEPVTPESMLVVNRTAADNGDGTVTLTVEAYVMGAPVEGGVPADIILVVDESAAMTGCTVCGRPGSTDETQRYHCEKIFADYLAISQEYGTFDQSTQTYCKVKWCQGCCHWAAETADHDFEAAADPGSCTGAYLLPFAEEGEEERTEEIDGKTVVHCQLYKHCLPGQSRGLQVPAALAELMALINADAMGADGLPGTADDLHHQVALVGYGADGKLHTYREAEGGLVSKTVAGDAPAADLCQNVFLDAADSGDYDLLRIAAEDLAQEGDGNLSAGLTIAREILEANAADRFAADEANTWHNEDHRMQYVIVLSGAPAEAADGAADEAVQIARAIKGRAQVYAIGAFPDAAGDAGRLLQLVSSAYPYAAGFSDGYEAGAVSAGQGYYVPAESTEDFEAAFRSVYGRISAESKVHALDGETVLRSAVPAGCGLADVSAVKAYSMTFMGEFVDETTGQLAAAWAADTEAYTPTMEGSAVTVSGFDYVANAAGYGAAVNIDGSEIPTPQGKKLVLEFTVKADGAADMSGSGIYRDGTLIG